MFVSLFLFVVVVNVIVSFLVIGIGIVFFLCFLVIVSALGCYFMVFDGVRVFSVVSV